MEDSIPYAQSDLTIKIRKLNAAANRHSSEDTTTFGLELPVFCPVGK